MTEQDTRSDPPGHTTESEYTTPYEEKLAGETEVAFQCGVAANDDFDEDDFEYCSHEIETVELDEPAYVDDKGNVHLPGRPMNCPECGNDNMFRFNGLLVMFR